MMSVHEVISAIRWRGGMVEAVGDRLHALVPDDLLSEIAPILKEHKAEILEALKSECWWRSPSGERVTVFPSCPACGSYALYRERPGEPYECLTCCAQGIPEAEARQPRTQENQR